MPEVAACATETSRAVGASRMGRISPRAPGTEPGTGSATARREPGAAGDPDAVAAAAAGRTGAADPEPQRPS